MEKVCVITGASGGIGYQLAEGFNREGFQVIAMDLEKTRSFSEGIDFRLLDLSIPEEITVVFQDILETYGAIHVLINNAATYVQGKTFVGTPLEDVDRIINVNLRGTYLCSQCFVKANKGERFGRIINIASTRWHQNEAGVELYGATKGGIVSLTNSLCVTLSETPITVNCISPGWIENYDYENLSEEDHRQHPSGRVGRPDDILRVCLFLTDERNDFINGHNMIVDGGMTKKMIYVE